MYSHLLTLSSKYERYDHPDHNSHSPMAQSNSMSDSENKYVWAVAISDCGSQTEPFSAIFSTEAKAKAYLRPILEKRMKDNQDSSEPFDSTYWEHDPSKGAEYLPESWFLKKDVDAEVVYKASDTKECDYDESEDGWTYELKRVKLDHETSENGCDSDSESESECESGDDEELNAVIAAYTAKRMQRKRKSEKEHKESLNPKSRKLQD